MSFHLRPVSDNSPSPSPTNSLTPPGDHSSPLPPPLPVTPHGNGRPRRPLSPSSLRDVDLTPAPDMPPRKYPTPPTGHQLMAMFPPPPPDNFPEMRPGPTSGYFQRQERAFFAQAGKEIVRVRVEVDLPHEPREPEHSPQAKSRGRELHALRTWPQHHNQPSNTASSTASSSSGPSHHSPVQLSPSIPLTYPHPSGATGAQRSNPHRGSIPVTPASLFPPNGSQQQPLPQLPPNLHQPTLHPPTIGLRTPPQDGNQAASMPKPKSELQPEDYIDNDDAWRRPMPYNERRRAGKHTRRVIVKT